jgi:nitroreductase
LTAPTSDDLWEVMSTARAIRRYRDEPVDQSIIDRCLQAATWAPSGGNQQLWRFIELRSPELRAIIGDGARESWEIMTEFYGLSVPDPEDQHPRARTVRTMHDYMMGAATVPICFLFCVQPQRGTTALEAGGSIFPAMQNFLLAARSQGLGASVALWHRSKEDQLRPIIGIPDDWEVASTVTAGWPVGRHGPLNRKPIDKVSSVDSWI